MNQPLHEGSIVPIELSIGEWNALLTVLMDAGPYRVVNPLIMKIGNGVKQYVEFHNAQLQPQLPVERVVNGVDTDSAG